jgi:sec-independent protein translocase protein TatB
VCDLSFWEFVVIVVVAVVVVGPRQLPSTLRTAGRWLAKLRNMAMDMREQSGIDTILREEGLEKDIQQLRSLLRKGNVLNALAIEPSEGPEPRRTENRGAPGLPGIATDVAGVAVDNWSACDREYPVAGADAYDLATEDIDPYRVAAEEASRTMEDSERGCVDA